MDAALPLPDRDVMEFDVVIVGAGPAGLSAAIRLKQLAPDLSVAVLEKGSEVGAHILSGAVIDPIGLDRADAGLAERRRADRRPRLPTTASSGSGRQASLRLPNFLMPPLMSNHGNYIASLGDVCRWLAGEGRGRSASRSSRVSRRSRRCSTTRARSSASPPATWASVATGPKPGFQRGMELHAKYTLIAEGARGSLAKRLIRALSASTRDASRRNTASASRSSGRSRRRCTGRGLVQHSFGWPLDNRTGGGSFLYHFGENLVAVGFVVHLNYRNPHLSPFEEFQRFKTPSGDPPAVRRRQAPRLRRPRDHRGRLAVGAEAASSPAARSSAARPASSTCRGSRAATTPSSPACSPPSASPRRSPRAARTTSWPATRRPGGQAPSAATFGACATSSRSGRASAPFAGIALGGLDMWANTLRLRPFGTLRHGKPDYAATAAGARGEADRLSEARRRADLRPAVLGVPLQHLPRGGPAGAPARRATWRCRSPPSTTSMAGRRRATARPASMNGSRTGRAARAT